jgi:Trk K+ transport system NAD-binding subunit
MQDPNQKVTKDKRAGSVAQVVECLPSKHKALNSNPSTANIIIIITNNNNNNLIMIRLFL